MPTLTIGNLSEEDHKALRIRAARHGVSMEGEVRAILHEALREQPEAARVRRAPPESPSRARGRPSATWSVLWSTRPTGNA
jgi:plasmid stability protein